MSKSCTALKAVMGCHLGLYAEETGPCAEMLGNFPQALAHVGLISGASYLGRPPRSHDTRWPGLASDPWQSGLGRRDLRWIMIAGVPAAGIDRKAAAVEPVATGTSAEPQSTVKRPSRKRHQTGALNESLEASQLPCESLPRDKRISQEKGPTLLGIPHSSLQDHLPSADQTFTRMHR